MKRIYLYFFYATRDQSFIQRHFEVLIFQRDFLEILLYLIIVLDIAHPIHSQCFLLWVLDFANVLLAEVLCKLFFSFSFYSVTCHSCFDWKGIDYCGVFWVIIPMLFHSHKTLVMEMNNQELQRDFIGLVIYGIALFFLLVNVVFILYLPLI